MLCQICGRKLDVAADVLSQDCGGDCWGCVGMVEAELGDENSIGRVQREIALGLRSPGGSVKNALK